MDKVVLNDEVYKVWDGDDYDTHPSNEGYIFYAAWIKLTPGVDAGLMNPQAMEED